MKRSLFFRYRNFPVLQVIPAGAFPGLNCATVTVLFETGGFDETAGWLSGLGALATRFGVGGGAADGFPTPNADVMNAQSARAAHPDFMRWKARLI